MNPDQQAQLRNYHHLLAARMRENMMNQLSSSAENTGSGLLAPSEGDPATASLSDTDRAVEELMDIFVAGSKALLSEPPRTVSPSQISLLFSFPDPTEPPSPPTHATESVVPNTPAPALPALPIRFPAEVAEEDALMFLEYNQSVENARTFVCRWEECGAAVRVRDRYIHLRDAHGLHSRASVGVCRWTGCPRALAGRELLINDHYFWKHVGVSCPLCWLVFESKTAVKEHLRDGQCEFMQSAARESAERERDAMLFSMS